MGQADVLVLKNICDPDILPVISRRRRASQLTVYELADDICHIPPWNPVHFFYKDKENLLLFKRLAYCCDAMQFSVPELHRSYGYLNACSMVFPNQISDVPPERTPGDSGEIVVGWGGSHGHLEDMAAISEPLMDWILSRRNVRLHLMCSSPIWQLFDRLPTQRKRRIETGSLQDYYGFLRGIDIGLAPLENTAFNRSRSDVKFLEYAIHTVAPVVKALAPYAGTVAHGVTGLLYKDAAGMVDVLNRLADDAPLVTRVARAARRYVIDERLQHAHSKGRIGFYRRALGALNGGGRGVGSSAGRLATHEGMQGASRKGRHLKLMSTRFEDLLHDGLLMSQVKGEKRLAGRMFSEASRLEPDSHLPYLFGASCSGDAAGWLRQAVTRNPHSIKSWILMGEAYARKGDATESIRCFRSAAEVFPEYEIPYLRTAAILQELGRREEARSLQTKVEQLICPLEVTDPQPPNVGGTPRTYPMSRDVTSISGTRPPTDPNGLPRGPVGS